MDPKGKKQVKNRKKMNHHFLLDEGQGIQLQQDFSW